MMAAEPLSDGRRGRRHRDPDDQEKGKRAHHATPGICEFDVQGTDGYGTDGQGTADHRDPGSPGTATILGHARSQRQQQMQ